MKQSKVSKVKTKDNSSPKKRLCRNCITVIWPWIEHTCNDTTTLENLQVILEKKSVIAETFAAHVIKSRPASPNRTRRLSVLHGKILPVTIGPSEPPTKPISEMKK